MKPHFPQKDPKFNLLTRGIYINTADTIDKVNAGQKKNCPKWVYIAARIIVLLLGITLFILASACAVNGYWTLATVCFITTILFFIGFVNYGRKISELRKARNN